MNTNTPLTHAQVTGLLTAASGYTAASLLAISKVMEVCKADVPDYVYSSVMNIIKICDDEMAPITARLKTAAKQLEE